MQLVAMGAQDIYLTGNPQITFFKVVYRRHTNFSMESIEQTFNGTPDFGRKVVCTISRNGDLIHRVYLQVELPGVRVNLVLTTSDGSTGSATLLSRTSKSKLVVRELTSTTVTGLHIWNELTQTSGKQAGLRLYGW